MTTARRRYPRATVRRAGVGVWTTDDGYRIVRGELAPGVAEYRVHIPGGLRSRANVLFMWEAREVICALRASNNECPNARLL
jgi:hypothetical protein